MYVYKLFKSESYLNILTIFKTVKTSKRYGKIMSFLYEEEREVSRLILITDQLSMAKLQKLAMGRRAEKVI